MLTLRSILHPSRHVHAHCDIPCGVYDPEQARIEAESCYRIIEKYAANEDPAYRTRALAIKEERAELAKHHLDVLWHDYFKPEHLEAVPNLHDLFWQANKQVSKVKASTDLADAKGELFIGVDVGRDHAAFPFQVAALERLLDPMAFQQQPHRGHLAQVG